MTDTNTFSSTEDLISHLRHGRMVLMLVDDSEGSATGIVLMAAELCEPEHITFMARQARGLVCLGMTSARCRQLNLPLMVESQNDSAPFTLSIEAATGIDTGISAVDRARTVRVAVDPETVAQDLVQPGHIFPVAATAGGVLSRPDKAEAGTDLTSLAGLLPAAVFTEVLDQAGDIARGDALLQFAETHDLPVGRVSDLVNYRLANERTIERVKSGFIETAHGKMELSVFRETHNGTVHLALTRGEIDKNKPTLVRVHTTSVFRDLIGTALEGQVSWTFDRCLAAISEADRGVLVLITRPETATGLLASVDRLLSPEAPQVASAKESYASVGLGAQILNELGVGQIRLLGAPLTYNALSGFGLEVIEFAFPE